MEYKAGKAKVRIHGTPDMENFREATEAFLKKAQIRRKKENKNGNDDDAIQKAG